MGAPKAIIVDSSSALDSLHFAPVARPNSQKKLFKPTKNDLVYIPGCSPPFEIDYAISIGKAGTSMCKFINLLQINGLIDWLEQRLINDAFQVLLSVISWGFDCRFE